MISTDGAGVAEPSVARATASDGAPASSTDAASSVDVSEEGGAEAPAAEPEAPAAAPTVALTIAEADHGALLTIAKL